MRCHDQRINDREDAAARPCGDCGTPMMLAAALPRLGVLPALRSYRCAVCGNVELDVLEHLQPLSETAATKRARPGRDVGGC
jgi:hypothetical protein